MSNVPSHNNDLSIPEGVTFVGSINVPGVAQINGDITGQITCKQLEVGPKGNIKGQIQAQGIQVHGQLENDINCKGLVKIFKTGKVSGKRPALAQASVGIVFMTPYQPSASLFPAPPWRWCLVSQPLLQRSSFTYSSIFQALTFSGTS